MLRLYILMMYIYLKNHNNHEELNLLEIFQQLPYK